MKITIFILLGLMINGVVNATELKMHIETSKSGTNHVYIENVGSQNHLVITKGLSSWTSGTETEISPDTHVWIRNNKKIILKASIEKYGPVLLKPGEITFIERPLINNKSGTVIYKIKDEWAALHGTWSGTLKTSYGFMYRKDL
jgi:hypothetical protein